MTSSPQDSSERRARNAGVALVDVLMVVAVLSTIVSIGYFATSGLTASTANLKLRSDVATLNAAIEVYQASGGSLEDVSDAQGALNALMTTTAGDNRRQIAGLRGTMTDLRVKINTGSSLSGNVAKWNPTKKRFEMQSGGTGILSFELDDESNGASVEERNVNLRLALQDNWIWDYEDKERPDSTITHYTSNDPDVGHDSTVNPDPAAYLLPPGISIPSGEYPLIDYPLQVELTNPNPVGSSEIFYSLGDDIWTRYVGSPVPVEPDETLTAYSGTMRPFEYINSEKVSESYTTQPVRIEVALTSPGTSFNYFELGGAHLSSPGGTVPAAYDPAGPATTEITNTDAIPDFLLNSSSVEFPWTTDGTSPDSGSNGVQTGSPFSGGFPGVEIPLTLDMFGDGTSTVSLQSVALSQTPYLLDSEIVSAELSPETLQLRLPVVELTYNDRVEIAVDLKLDPSWGDLPEGARIFYTTDGTDPGSGSIPRPGAIEFTSSFVVTTDTLVNARVYPPESAKDWFTPSVALVETIAIPEPPSLYVGGQFVRNGGQTHRNIARLGNAGELDSSFHPGTGASVGSVVGAMIPTQGDGVFAGGNFESVNGTRRLGVARLKDSGAVDTSFDAGLR